MCLFILEIHGIFMAQKFNPNPKQVIEDLEQIDYILSKKIEEKQNGTKEKWTDSSES